ncbi:hypothetical protein D9611_004806 [Ephemerocybe angulata]|uniref:Uncharacterized protein n=2 Tax=Ephemerocybe angulata TaxID=980116 RepID=A0A8H6IGQ9_9AGAR|nr:hypothetical protein D9611_004806 [Tulosesus angulatus]KAF6764032.1 hypothetical protein DFP72DRAFT_986709 [Tulosesus angulatus]
MPSFNPKPFPPPALSDVPVEYIVDQLHSLGAQYWDKPETADCTIIVPIPHAQNNPLQSLQTQFPGEPSNSVTVSFEHSGGGNRRATQPPLNAAPRLSLELHMDYLSAHSTYLRGLFSGALPLDLMYSQTPPASSSTTGVPPDRQPRLMPSAPDHPILFLPLPDPSSFHLLVHWMYFGDLTRIADCLHRGVIQWEGIARNVEYLGLSADIKLFLSKWYSTWLDAAAARNAAQEQEAEDSDTAYSDSDDDDRMSSSTESDLEEELADLENLKEPSSRSKGRGRDTDVRPLSFQSFAAPQAAS